jgi:hypothetical protein
MTGDETTFWECAFWACAFVGLVVVAFEQAMNQIISAILGASCVVVGTLAGYSIGMKEGSAKVRPATQVIGDASNDLSPIHLDRSGCISTDGGPWQCYDAEGRRVPDPGGHMRPGDPSVWEGKKP